MGMSCGHITPEDKGPGVPRVRCCCFHQESKPIVHTVAKYFINCEEIKNMEQWTSDLTFLSGMKFHNSTRKGPRRALFYLILSNLMEHSINFICVYT